MKPIFPSLTAEWHNDTYPDIDPKRPNFSLQGKRVVVTGGGAGIGRGFTQAFADAGADSVAILGRRAAMLEETKELVTSKNSNAIVTIHTADVMDGAALEKVASEIGKWDILVSNAGYMSKSQPISEADPEEWWKSFELNCKGSFNTIRAFLPHRSTDATMVAINAGLIQVPPSHAPGVSAYSASKMAALKIFEAAAAEHPDLHVVSMHPGIIATEMTVKSGAPALDKVELPAHFAVWLCSEEAKYLRGRFVWCNWDVPQLMQKKAEIEANPLLLTGNCIGWPFA